MDRFWEKVREGIHKGVNISKDAVELYSKIGKLKVEQFGHKRTIDESYKSLGIRLHDMIKDKKTDDVAEDIAVLKFIEDIDSAETAIGELEERIIALRAESEEKSAEAAQAAAAEAEASTLEEAEVTVVTSSDDTAEAPAKESKAK